MIIYELVWAVAEMMNFPGSKQLWSVISQHDSTPTCQYITKLICDHTNRSRDKKIKSRNYGLTALNISHRGASDSVEIESVKVIQFINCSSRYSRIRQV